MKPECDNYFSEMMRNEVEALLSVEDRAGWAEAGSVSRRPGQGGLVIPVFSRECCRIL